MSSMIPLLTRSVFQASASQGPPVIVVWISNFVTSVLYPLILLGVFALIVLGVVYAIRGAHRADPETGRIRALVGSLLPIVILVFIVLASPSGVLVRSSVTDVPGWFQIVIGAGFGVFIMLSGIWVTEANRVVAFSLYALVLSALAAFLLYCLVQGFVDQVHLYWLGGIVGAGLYTVFVGLPRHGIETPDSPPGL